MPAINNVFFNARDVDASASSSDDQPTPWTFPNIPGWVGYLALAVAIIFMVATLVCVVYFARKYSAKWLRHVPEHKPRHTLSKSEIRRLKVGKLPREIIAPPPRAHIAAAPPVVNDKRAPRPASTIVQPPRAHIAAPAPPVVEDALHRITRNNTLKNQRRAAQLVKKPEVAQMAEVAVAPPLQPILRPEGARW
ncbi:hypothetical protein C8R46DRAFT_1262118 [Mycena filopes]|nr:hypothetical protein C8R46DRAFT_1262118 [Mycena filopes]